MTVVIANGVKEPWHAITLGQQVLTVINERLPIQGIQLRPSASIGIAMYSGADRRAALSSGFLGRVHRAAERENQIQFFDPEQMEKAQQRLTEERHSDGDGQSPVCALATAAGQFAHG